MIKKLVGVAVALALVAGLAATAYAADFRFGGWFRYRGIASDNQDRLDTVKGAPGDLGRDANRYYDSVFRPTFTATMEDKARVFFQLDIPAFNSIGGDDCKNFGTILLCTDDDSRTNVNVVVYNLQVKVPFVPGPWFFRVGRDNAFLPRGLVARLPNLREFSLQLWGTVGPIKPRFEAFKRDESSGSTASRGLDFADDDDVYIVKLPVTPMKGLRIMPYFTLHEQNRRSTTGATTRIFYPGVSASARYKMFSAKVDFVYQIGNMEFSQAGGEAGACANNAGLPCNSVGGNADQDVSAFVLWLQSGVTMGPANFSVNWVIASGDRDQNDNDQNQFFGVGCGTSDGGGAIGLFTGCDARAQGPTDLWFGDKYSDINTVGSRNIGGNTGGAGGRYARGNGTNTVSFDGSYRPLKNLLLQATVGFIQSFYARPDMTSGGTTPFDKSRYIGTEFDVSATWSIYKGVSLNAGFDYLAAGDYGKLRTKIANASQVPGGTNRLVNENDDSWQAVWRLQWAF